MLKALDEDPKRCGYTESQIKKGLDALSQKAVKQLGVDAAHLYHLLVSKDLIDKNEHTLSLAKEHKEIEKARFDNERSVFTDLPEYIRKPLFDIISAYTEGQVQLIDRKWHTFAINQEHYKEPYFLNKKT